MRKLILLLALFACAPVYAQNFVVEEIRVDGLQRISEGTVFSFLPLEVGDRLTPAAARASIRDLYRSGFFENVELAREGNILIIEVSERPAISTVIITGNKKIPDEALMPALEDIGIVEGEVFDRLALDQVSQELIRQYYAQGHYNVEVDTRLTRLDRNRVDIGIVIEEGKVARIRHINLVGNESFDEDELREDFESDTKNAWGGLFFWQGRPNYTREKLSGDLERLRAFYLDRGYVDFAIESTQVSVSPDRTGIYITANVREGEVYSVSDVQLTGDLVFEQETLENFVALEPGATFSREKVEQTVDNITALLANFGYAFANVNPVPRIDRESKSVDLTFFVDPGKRVYVRRVEFRGNTVSKDEVLRREMRQFEGAWFSQAAVDRSRQRLRRIGYFEDVNVETPAVEGSDDQVDIIVSVEERSTGSFQVGLGFSQLQGLIASISVQQENFLGSGRTVGFAVSRSRINRQVNLSYTNPYWTDDGISRGFFLNYSEFNQARANISAFSTSQAAAGVNFGFPLTEVDFVRLGASYQALDINIGSFVTVPVDPDDPDGPSTIELSATRPLAITLDRNGDGFLSGDERDVETFVLNGSWGRDTRNHFLTPTRGSLNRLSLSLATPGSTREYYTVAYRGRKYWPLGENLAFAVRADVSYGDVYDDEELDIEQIEPERLAGNCQLDEIVTADFGLPFWEHFFAGGVSDVRGFDDNSLGPKDQFCRSVGGDFKVTGGVEIAFPLPFAEISGTRMAWFVDVGNVFEGVDTFDQNLLRASTGLSLTWEAPVGPIIINLSTPLKDRPGDDVQEIQFSFGAQF
ncbi:outer membrane protein assembly factor BamA [Wenzhouxiangella sp. XN79A]|uniref:outer membrane protein assembly factor BamA n=1 Tax=Wenzhouxiangella sp. XN79A TaxID=2724193 RepID=UPI00144ACFB9|nr:outer membrane protein assembly factor BamA [Wenzhouxiangella sp. XN79A]NKI35007.1 outer membrane protein assembly factor BamA [Wenzhouxiangella sp. XN79A]